MIVWPKATARGRVQEGNVLSLLHEARKPKFLIKILTLKTNDCLSECYVHEIGKKFSLDWKKIEP